MEMRMLSKILGKITLRYNDLLRDAAYRRLWISVIASSFGSQIMILCLPLTAAVSLHASATQMGILSSMGTLPFVLFALPSGVWLDRVRKLPVYISGEVIQACAAASVPIAWWLGALPIGWLYLVAFIGGLVNTTAGSASQIVLTQIVERDRLVEANAKNALASSGAEVAGALVKLVGAPMALLVDAVLLLLSAGILKGIKVNERLNASQGGFWESLKAGLRFVISNRLLVVLACFIAAWQFCANSATVVNILFATRVLGLSGQNVGLSYMCLGLGTVLASLYGASISKRIGIGYCLTLGFAMCSCGFLMLSAAPQGPLGYAVFSLYLLFYGFGNILIFVNFISLRQAVTPRPMLGRMTSIMRWLILIPSGPGALAGGWIGQHVGLRSSLEFAGISGLVITSLALCNSFLRKLKSLPAPDNSGGILTTEPTNT
jgi:MFS family permease